MFVQTEHTELPYLLKKYFLKALNALGVFVVCIVRVYVFDVPF